MARCLVDLGLRVGEVARLKLENFDWRQGTLQIVGTKGRRADILPLPVETGRAIVQYLRHARPKCTSRSLFIRHMAPLDRPLTTEIVCWAMRCAYARAGPAHDLCGQRDRKSTRLNSSHPSISYA